MALATLVVAMSGSIMGDENGVEEGLGAMVLGVDRGCGVRTNRYAIWYDIRFDTMKMKDFWK
jgi:hypothetical protein